MPYPTNDPTFREISAQIDEIADRLTQELYAKILDGQNVARSIKEMENAFVNEVRPIILSAIAEQLGKSIFSKEIKDYRVGGLSLSNALYRDAIQVSQNALAVINKHIRGFQNAKELLLDLFEGYSFKEKEILDVKKALPKYLKKPFAKIQVSKLVTPALRAAYLPVVDKMMEGAFGNELQSVLRVAVYERNRYFASRIARTELSRAVNDKDASDFMKEPELAVVEIRLSQKHPIVDICDYHSTVNKFGLGPGVYPKASAPKPPYHPHCFCSMVPRYDLDTSGLRIRYGADRGYLRGLKKSDGIKIIGSREKYDEFMASKKKEPSLLDVVDEGKKEIYKTKFVGDYS